MTKRNDIYSIILLLTAGLLAGCSVLNEPEQKKEISISTGVTSLQKRAAAINGSTDLQDVDLRIDAYYHGTETKCLDAARLHYNSSSWVFWDGSAPLHYYWPVEGSVYTPAIGDPITVSSLDFVGYCPYDLTYTGVALGEYSSGTLQMTCTLPMASTGEGNTQANLQEFLWAYTDDQTKDSNSGTVNLSFQHPFARVRFYLSASHPDIKVNKIAFKSLKSGGTCTFDGSTSTWTSLTPAGTVDFVMTYTGDAAVYNSNPASPRQIGSDYIVVPQTFAGDIEVNAGWIDWGEVIDHNVSTTISSQTWEAGCSYTYTFTIRETDLRVDIQKYTEQW